MSEPRETGTPENADETLVTPRFDEEETVLAQPVVPLDAEEAPPADPAAPLRYTPRPTAASRQWPLALILVSALAGSVLGGAGLYFFQKHLRSGAATAEAPAPESAEPQTEQAAEQAAEAAPESGEPAAAEPAPVIEASAPREDEAPEPPAAKGADARTPEKDEGARAPEKEKERAPEAGATKRGKKAEPAEDERRPRARTTPREQNDDDGGARASREARRVDTITYPTRREQRRAERQAERRERRAARNVDRVRAIFEGQP